MERLTSSVGTQPTTGKRRSLVVVVGVLLALGLLAGGVILVSQAGSGQPAALHEVGPHGDEAGVASRRVDPAGIHETEWGFTLEPLRAESRGAALESLLDPRSLALGDDVDVWRDTLVRLWAPGEGAFGDCVVEHHDNRNTCVVDVDLVVERTSADRGKVVLARPAPRGGDDPELGDPETREIVYVHDRPLAPPSAACEALRRCVARYHWLGAEVPLSEKAPDVVGLRSAPRVTGGSDAPIGDQRAEFRQELKEHREALDSMKQRLSALTPGELEYERLLLSIRLQQDLVDFLERRLEEIG
jgi:hypothetical protein